MCISYAYRMIGCDHQSKIFIVPASGANVNTVLKGKYTGLPSKGCDFSDDLKITQIKGI